MEDKILLFLQFGTELIRMWIGMSMIFGFQLTKKWSAGLTYALFSIVLFTGVLHTSDMGVIMWVLIFALFLITIKTPESKDWKWKLLCGFVLLYQEELICIIVGDVLHLYWNDITIEVQEMINSFISLVTLGVIGYFYRIIRNRLGDDKVTKYFRNIMIPLIIFLTIEIMLVIVYLNYVLKTSDDIKGHILSMVLSIFAMISVGILFAVVAYVKNANEKMEQMLLVNQKMQRLEIEHYETLLKKEENTKRYRHDVIHHLVCLEEMLQNKETDDAKIYVGEMLSRIQRIRNCNYDTGNQILNTILNYYVTQLSEEVDVAVKGQCKKEINVSDYDMSTIFANLFKNAVEAIQISGCKNPILFVEIKEGKTFVQIVIKNSMRSDEIAYDETGMIQTTKQDKTNHGIGLLNVREAVRKNKGVYECSVSEDGFCCIVTLRVKNVKN